jgi:hypothetical protein
VGKIPSWEDDSRATSQIPRPLLNPTPAIGPILSHMNPIHTLISSSYTIHFNITLPLSLHHPRGYSPSGLYEHWKPVSGFLQHGAEHFLFSYHRPTQSVPQPRAHRPCALRETGVFQQRCVCSWRLYISALRNAEGSRELRERERERERTRGVCKRAVPSGQLLFNSPFSLVDFTPSEYFAVFLSSFADVTASQGAYVRSRR